MEEPQHISVLNLTGLYHKAISPGNSDLEIQQLEACHLERVVGAQDPRTLGPARALHSLGEMPTFLCRGAQCSAEYGSSQMSTLELKKLVMQDP